MGRWAILPRWGAPAGLAFDRRRAVVLESSPCESVGTLVAPELQMPGGERSGRLLLVFGVLVVFVWMIRTLLVPIALAGVFALLLFPIAQWLGKKLGRFRWLAPFLTTAAALLLVVFPLAGVVAKAGASITEFAAALGPETFGDVRSSVFRRLGEIAESIGIPTARIRDLFMQGIQSAGARTAVLLQALIGSLPNAMVDLFLFVLALYFFLRDGGVLGRKLDALSPFEEVETSNLVDSILGTVRGAVLGTIAVAIIQGALTIIAFLVFRVPGAFVFGVIAGFLSLIPMIGTIPVSGGAILYLISEERYGSAIGFAVFAAVVVGASDNVVRPLVQSTGGRLHPLMALLGIFGGLAAMGPAGIFIGPVIAGVVVWMIGYFAAKRLEDPARSAET